MAIAGLRAVGVTDEAGVLVAAIAARLEGAGFEMSSHEVGHGQIEFSSKFDS